MLVRALVNFCCNTFTLKSQDNTLIDTCLALLKRSLPRVIPCNLSGNNLRWWQQRFSQWWVACFFESLWSLLRRTSCIVSQLVIHVWLLQLNINVNIWGWRNYRHWHSTGCAVPLRSQMIKLCWGGEVYQDFLKLHFSILSLQRSYF